MRVEFEKEVRKKLKLKAVSNKRSKSYLFWFMDASSKVKHSSYCSVKALS